MRWSSPTAAHDIRRIAPTLLAAALAGAYLIVAPAGADLPAQLLRVKLFAAEGFGIWNNWWYGGHAVLGYSVLFPPLGWLLGPRLLAALACVGAAAAGEAMAHDVHGEHAWLGATWLGAATVTELLSGRLTFALGLCGAALTTLLLLRRRPRLAAVMACGTALASPVAGLFVALAGAVVVWRGLKTRNRNDIADGIGAISVQILLLGGGYLLFPTAGYQPFAFATLWPLLAAGLLILLLAPGRTLGAAVVLYLAGCVAAYAIHTPIGGNAARLGELAAGPLVALLLVPRRAWLLLALAALPLTYLQVHAAIGDLQHGAQADGASYYRPLLRFLARQPGLWRVEVPFTQGHWESYYLAPRFPLARGWERQADIADDPLFYEGSLTAARYERWLQRLAVRYVAVADAPPDYSTRAELRLIAGGLPYLRVVTRLPHWTVYAVAHAAPLATGAGRVVSIGPGTLTLAIAHRGGLYLRVRWSPYWELSGVRGCVAPAGGFTRISAAGAGRALLRTRFALTRVGSRAPRCN
ncbi:MAG: hypothetical protein KGL15_04260 [Acidobacteriota bacterium]|nr:hypothetical protein [Acidobacteriota bacterium]